MLNGLTRSRPEPRSDAGPEGPGPLVSARSAGLESKRSGCTSYRNRPARSASATVWQSPVREGSRQEARAGGRRHVM